MCGESAYDTDGDMRIGVPSGVAGLPTSGGGFTVQATVVHGVS